MAVFAAIQIYEAQIILKKHLFCDCRIIIC